ncbi:hypothetical protein ACH5RR_003622 [Cinchona calisaya]|uniref:RING-type domain-containing protein n=1 Tax=Cinchona calisaya TaxID=153742 RepID=A0ABD3AVP0_9GENT
MDCSHNHDAIINSGEPRKVDQVGEDHTEKKEFCEGVTISEPSSSTITKKGKGINVEASKSLSTSLTKKASKSRRKEIRADEYQSPAPVHHITWDGFDETCESVGETCFLCERDLSSPTFEVEEGDEFEYYDQYFEKSNLLPDVSVLGCGHAFHSQCLDNITPEDQLSDPPCLLCLSCGT